MAETSLGNVLRQLRRLYAAEASRDLGDDELLERFLVSREEAAFTVLLQRHGPMVLGVCQRLLGDAHAAEDAFQATFLVLVRRGAGIRKRTSLAAWLYGVAQRISRTARAAQPNGAGGNGKRLRDLLTDALDERTWQELCVVLDEEIGCLAERYRAPLVLCYLEGKSYDQAAQELGWPKSSLARRLARAREILRDGLAKRGVALSAAALLAALSERAAAAVLPASLTLNTVKGAGLVAAGQTAPGTLSAQAIALAEASMKGYIGLKGAVLAVLLLGSLVAGAAGLASYPPAGEKPAPVAQKDAGEPAPQVSPQPAKQDGSHAAAEQGTITIAGRVLDPSGKACAGAKVFFARLILAIRETSSAPEQETTTGADGRFRLRVSRSGYRDEHERKHWPQGAVVAVAKGFAFSWVGGDNVEKLTDVTIQLARDVPIEGRVLDLQGKPIAGVSVHLRNIYFRKQGGSLEEFVDGLIAGQSPYGPKWPEMSVEPPLVGVTALARTGSDGRFRFTGIRGDCLATLRFDGPTIESAQVSALTRSVASIYVPRNKFDLLPRGAVYHGASFDHVAAPTREITGIVRDKDSGKALAGITIQTPPNRVGGEIHVRAITDAEGRYRIVGLSREGRHTLQAVPPPELAYLRAALTVKGVGSSGPARLDFALNRGVQIRGRVTDKETGRPVPAVVVYYAFADNPDVRRAAGFRGADTVEVRTGEDGAFTVVGLPGQGLIAVKATNRDQQARYLTGAGADEIKGARHVVGFNTEPSICDISLFNAVAEVNPASDAISIARDMVLEPGKTVKGTIVGPDEQPVTGAQIDVISGLAYRVQNLPTAQFSIPGIDPKHPRVCFFRDREEKLGAAILLKGDETSPVTVRLQKCATVMGRLVDEDGQPCSACINAFIQKGQISDLGVGGFIRRVGKDGRFRAEGIIPGLKMSILAGKNFRLFDQELVPEITLQPGEVRDLGDLRPKPMP